jgi:hypothetical protein
MRYLFLSLVGLALSACAQPEMMRTGVVMADGSIRWNPVPQPRSSLPEYSGSAPSSGPTGQQVAQTIAQGVTNDLGRAFTAAGAYYGGRAQGYSDYQAQHANDHGFRTIWVNGQPVNVMY